MESINLNSYVWVKLTDEGREELLKQHISLHETISETVPEFKVQDEDEDGWSRWQLHYLISKLGHMVRMGRDVPFETTLYGSAYTYGATHTATTKR